jgi:hypothetical protein
VPLNDLTKGQVVSLQQPISPTFGPGLWEDVDDLVEAPEAGVTVCSVGCMVIGVLWRAILWALVCLLAVKFFGNLHTRLLIEAVKLDYGLV